MSGTGPFVNVERIMRDARGEKITLEQAQKRTSHTERVASIGDVYTENYQKWCDVNRDIDRKTDEIERLNKQAADLQKNWKAAQQALLEELGQHD